MPEVKAGNAERFAQAQAAMRAADYALAESLLKKIVDDQPELAGPWLGLALVYAATDRPGAQRKALDIAHQANPVNCDVLNTLAIAARQEGEFAAAERHYLTCLQHNPDYAVARLNLGILYELYMGRYSEALAAYQDYQLLLAEPDTRVDGWLADLERRVAAIASTH